VPIKGSRATASMGDGRLAINPAYWNPVAQQAYKGTGVTTKKIGKKQAEIAALSKDRDLLRDKYYSAIDSEDYVTARELDKQRDKIEISLGRKDAELKRLENALPKPASTWNVGDNLQDRPHSAKAYFDTPEEKFNNTVRHEFGHLVHEEHNRTGGEGGMFDEESPIEKYLESLFYQGGKRGNKRNETWVYPTNYSEFNHKEWFAESFSLYNGGKKELVEPKLVDFMDHMVEKEGRLTTFDGWDFVRGRRA